MSIESALLVALVPPLAARRRGAAQSWDLPASQHADATTILMRTCTLIRDMHAGCRCRHEKGGDTKQRCVCVCLKHLSMCSSTHACEHNARRRTRGHGYMHD